MTLHLVINDQGEILAWRLTAGNVADRPPVPTFAASLFGALVGDQGDLSQPLQEHLWASSGIRLITKRRKIMAPAPLTEDDAWLVRQRALIAAANGLRKCACQIAHSRQRSPTNFLVHLLSGVIAYGHIPQKPALPIVHGTPLAA